MPSSLEEYKMVPWRRFRAAAELFTSWKNILNIKWVCKMVWHKKDSTKMVSMNKYERLLLRRLTEDNSICYANISTPLTQNRQEHYAWEKWSQRCKHFIHIMHEKCTLTSNNSEKLSITLKSTNATGAPDLFCILSFKNPGHLDIQKNRFNIINYIKKKNRI